MEKNLEEMMLKLINALLDKHPEAITEIKVLKSSEEVTLYISQLYRIIIRPKIEHKSERRNVPDLLYQCTRPWEIIFLIHDSNGYLYGNLSVDVHYPYHEKLSAIFNKIYLLRIKRRFNSLYKKYVDE